MNENKIWEDKVVLIAGATGALGTAVTRRFAGTGARLALTGRSEAKLTALIETLGVAETRLFSWAADATDAEDVQALVNAVLDHFGELHMLLNTIGMYTGGARLQDVSLATWEQTLAVNLRSAFLLSRAVLPPLLEAGWGRLVHVGSKKALNPGGKMSSYAVAKMGVVALTQVIAEEVKGSGVTANVILPRVIDTPANRKMMPRADTGAWVPPDHIAEMIAFLCSEAGGSVNGATLSVEGGL
jgi:NAD(P)-dependent dehydrogenase (short-subunit alcohol dehydrogenase family)